MQKATADAIRMIKQASPSDTVIKLKLLEASAAAADRQATKIIIPSAIQGADVVSLLTEVGQSSKS